MQALPPPWALLRDTGNLGGGEVSDPKPSPRQDLGTSSQKTKPKKEEREKPKSTVVHQEDLQRQF